jgi:hypothetical protein
MINARTITAAAMAFVDNPITLFMLLNRNMVFINVNFLYKDKRFIRNKPGDLSRLAMGYALVLRKEVCDFV